MNLSRIIVVVIASFLISLGSNVIPPALSRQISHIMPQAQNEAAQTNISRNWSGYTATNGKFTQVNAEWTVPKIDGGFGQNGADATWVGIGGVSGDDLIQAGTQTTVGRDGSVSYEAFYEMLPDVSHPVSLSVSPGDSVSVSVVNVKDHTWHISIEDKTIKQEASFSVSYPSSFSSAEWIEEAPSGMNDTLPLDNFGKISFANATAVKNGKSVSLSDIHPTPITMGNYEGEILAATSTLGTDGKSFDVIRTDAPGGDGQTIYHLHTGMSSISAFIQHFYFGQ